MGLTVFDRKPKFRKDGELITDLTYASIRYSYDPTLVDYVLVNADTEMRPDLISRQAYGTTKYWDLLFKYNGISNPYAVQRTDILFIPALDEMTEQVTPDANENLNTDSVRKQYIDVSKKAKQDPKQAAIEKKRREAQRAKAEGKVQSKNNLPPNIAEVGDQEIVIKGGKIYFGPDVSKPQHECEQPISKTEFINRLIKNRILPKDSSSVPGTINDTQNSGKTQR